MRFPGQGGTGPGASGAVKAGLIASAAWVVLVLAFWLFGPEGAPRSGLARLGTLVGVVLPLVLIWAAVAAGQTLTTLRMEAAALRAMLQTMRDGNAPDLPAAPSAPVTAARPAPARPAPRPPAPEPRQPRLDLGPEPEVEPVTPEDLIAGLNFPDGPDDAHAIAALRNTLRDPELARLIRAAQDVITLLANQGVYMDDLPVSPPRPELWRRFAEGMRGDTVTGLAGIDAPDLEEGLRALLRQDQILRDTTDHFLRHYDRMLGRTVSRLSDAELVALSDTRSGRAFMLLARIAGVF